MRGIGSPSRTPARDGCIAMCSAVHCAAGQSVMARVTMKGCRPSIAANVAAVMREAGTLGMLHRDAAGVKPEGSSRGVAHRRAATPAAWNTGANGRHAVWLLGP